jgi:hypothetical protein
MKTPRKSQRDNIYTPYATQGTSLSNLLVSPGDGNDSILLPTD